MTIDPRRTQKGKTMADEFNQNQNTSEQNAGTNAYREYENEQANDHPYQGGQTGNGNYNYNNNYNNGYRNTYSNSYGSNGTNYNYGQTRYSGQTGYNQNNGRKKGGALKALLNALLAQVFGDGGGEDAYAIAQSVDRQTKNNDTAIESQDQAKAEDKSDAEVTAKDEDKDEAKVINLDVTDTAAVTTQVTQVAEDVMPSIVSVYNNFTQTTQDFFGQTYSQEGQSTGSGIIIANTGDELLIATNNHVIADADSLEVQFIDEETASASLKGTDSSNDLAVIAVNLKDIKDDTLKAISVASLGDSDKLKIGEPVVAIGNALGYGQSVTTGVVSALDREMTTEDGETGTFIQTDAAINPGNSGGALVDLNGNVIGINSNKIGGSTVEGMGYAIPMAKAEPIIEDLANQETKTKAAEGKQGYLGISGVSVTSQVASAYSMPEGVYIANIYEGSGAADSDLQKGDIVTKVDGTTVEDMSALQEQLTYHEAGSTITLTVQRATGNGDYAEQEIKVTLGDKSSIENAQEENEKSNRSQKQQEQQESEEQQGQQSQQGGFYQFPWGQFFGY